MLLQSFIKSWSVVAEMLCLTDRWMDCHTPHQISHCVILAENSTLYEPINHTASVTHSGYVLERDRWFCSYLCMLTMFLLAHKYCLYICVCCWAHACAGNAAVLLTGTSSFRCCLFCDILIHFDAGPSSVHTNRKTRALVASNSWSLIKSLAFVII